MINIIEYKRDLNIILNYIKEINLQDSFEIELNILEKFPDFYEKYPFIVKKISKNEDITMLYTMLDKIQQVQENNTSMTNVEKELGETLANKYLYPVLKPK